MADDDPNGPFTDPDQARAYLNGLSAHGSRQGDTSFLHPDYAVRMANAIKQARAAGLPVTLQSGFRTPDVTGSGYDKAGLSLHGYGASGDVGGIGGAGSPQAQKWAKIAAANQIYNPYGVGNPQEYNHWQLVPWKLESRPDIQAKLIAAKGDGPTIWNAISPISAGSAMAKAQKTAPDPATDLENDPVLGPYLKSAPAPAGTSKSAPADAATAAAAAPVDLSSDPILGPYLKPDQAVSPAAQKPGSYPLGDPRNQGLLPDSYKTPPPATNPVADQWSPDQSLPTQMGYNARDVGRYVLGQAERYPGAVASNFNSSAQLAGQGEDELAAGKYAPSFPSIDPRTWSAGGVAKTAVGGLGAVMSPISGAAQVAAQEPVTDISGSPELGEKAGMVANMLATPFVGRAIGRVPGAFANKLVGGLTPEDAALANMARTKYGIPLNATQMSSSSPVKFAGSVTERLPFSGAAADQANVGNAFTRAVSKTLGEDTDKITPDVMKSAKTRLGAEFDDIATKTTTKVDPTFVQDIHDVVNDASSVLGNDNVQPLINQVKKIYDTIDPNTGNITGESYQALTRKGTPLDRLMNSNDPNMRHYAGQIREAIDGAMQRSAPPDLQDRLSVARSQYKAMKTIEDLVEKSSTGTISPAALLTPVRGSYGSMAYSGGGDLGNLARIGQRFLKEPPSSGTAERLGAMEALKRAGAAAVSVAGGHQLFPSVVAPENALYLAGTIPASLAAGRAVGGTLRSQWLANNMLNRSLGRSNSPGLFDHLSGPDMIPLTAGRLTAPRLDNKLVSQSRPQDQ